MSGIYIPGLSMPRKTEIVSIVLSGDGSALLCEDGAYSEIKVIPVPEHGRLMDKDAVNLQDGPYEYDEWCEWALDQYMNAPIILPADKEETE